MRRLLILAAALLSGCAVGPDYHAPKLATPPVYGELGNAQSDPLSRPVATEQDLSRPSSTTRCWTSSSTRPWRRT
jgi:hypothetical protein